MKENLQQTILELVGARPIAFNPVLARRVGSIKAGLLLNQLLYWANKGKGFDFYKTIEEIEEETALSRHEQDTAIKQLKDLKVIKTVLRGSPPKRHFQIDLPEISNLICHKPSNRFAGNQQFLYIKEQENTTETTTENNEAVKTAHVDKSVDNISEEVDYLKLIQEPSNIQHSWQFEALEIIEKLNIPDKRRSALFKACKVENPAHIQAAYSFAVDHPIPGARDKMFFWKLSTLKKGKNDSAS